MEKESVTFVHCTSAMNLTNNQNKLCHPKILHICISIIGLVIILDTTECYEIFVLV